MGGSPAENRILPVSAWDAETPDYGRFTRVMRTVDSGHPTESADGRLGRPNRDRVGDSRVGQTNVETASACP